MVVLLKTTLVRVSFIQIVQIKVQNKSKSVCKSRYIWDVLTPPSLNHFLSSCNSVDKPKVIKKFFTTLLFSLLYICLTSDQVFSKDYEITIFMITFRSHIYSYQWHNQLASNNKISQMPAICPNNHDIIW